MFWVILFVSLVLGVHDSLSTECGKSNLPSTAADETGEHSAALGNFPWHVGIYFYSEGKWRHNCGGSLISPKIVITASICTPLDGNNLLVTFGKLNSSLESDEDYEIRRNVSSTKRSGNIGLLILDLEVPVNDYMRPVCLDFAGTHGLDPATASPNKGYVAGWGIPRSDMQVYDLIRYGRTSVVDHTKCVDLLETKVPSSAQTIRQRTDIVCDAGDVKEDVFQYNVGAGLTFVFDGVHYLMGVKGETFIEREEVVGKPKFTAAYTVVPQYYTWIKDQIENK